MNVLIFGLIILVLKEMGVQKHLNKHSMCEGTWGTSLPDLMHRSDVDIILSTRDLSDSERERFCNYVAKSYEGEWPMDVIRDSYESRKRDAIIALSEGKFSGFLDYSVVGGKPQIIALYVQHGLTKKPVGLNLLYGFLKVAEDSKYQNVAFTSVGENVEDNISASGKRFLDRLSQELGVDIKNPSQVNVSEVLMAFRQKGVDDKKIRFRQPTQT